MASLQARHKKTCATGKPWTTFEKASKAHGCTCTPTYFVVVRAGSGLTRERIGSDRQSAQRALTKIAVKADEGEYIAIKQIPFSEWGEGWVESLHRERSTKRSYRSTVNYAVRAFGSRRVRDISTEDVRRMIKIMQEDKISASTQAKHLRVLGACLQSAMVAGFTTRNVVRLLPRGEKPSARRQESAFFQNDELTPIFARVPHGVYRMLFQTALKTGMRLGELLALKWEDATLDVAEGEGVLHVRWSYTDGEVRRPKSHEKREVDLTADVVAMLDLWREELGNPAADTLIFPGPTKSGYLNPDMVRRALYGAMKSAKVARVGPTGESRTFHSFRHTFAKIALENGHPLEWVSRHLGHSSILVTARHYAHFERAASKRQIKAMEGAFVV